MIRTLDLKRKQARTLKKQTASQLTNPARTIRANVQEISVANEEKCGTPKPLGFLETTGGSCDKEGPG